MVFVSFTDILNTSPEVFYSHDFCSAVCSFRFYLDAPQHNPTTLLFWCGIFSTDFHNLWMAQLYEVLYVFFMAASNSATPLGPSEKTRGQMQTVWKGLYNGSQVFRHNVSETLHVHFKRLMRMKSKVYNRIWSPPTGVSAEICLSQ